MEGYDQIFKTAMESYEKDKDKYDFVNFRSCLNIFQFIVNNDPNPDGHALSIAYNINPEIMAKLLTIYKPNLGYASSPGMYTICDNLDSRHIMMSTILVDVLQRTNVSSDIKIIVEIGGGFGNWARLHTKAKYINFDKWTIVDIPHVIELQKWYLLRSLSEEEFKKIEFVTTDQYEDWVKTHENDQVDLVIASHSLSEFSYEIFKGYIPLIQRSKFLFYCYHKDQPHPFLIHDKKVDIEKDFDNLATFKSESGKVLNVVYKHK